MFQKLESLFQNWHLNFQVSNWFLFCIPESKRPEEYDLVINLGWHLTQLTDYKEMCKSIHKTFIHLLEQYEDVSMFHSMGVIGMHLSMSGILIIAKEKRKQIWPGPGNLFLSGLGCVTETLCIVQISPIPLWNGFFSEYGVNAICIIGQNACLYSWQGVPEEVYRKLCSSWSTVEMRISHLFDSFLSF